MHKLLTYIISAVIVAGGLFTAPVALAHPGGTSWDKCHYCKTNCSKWGYTPNTRHCHRKGLVPQFGVPDPKYYK